MVSENIAAPTARFFIAFDSSKNRLARKSAGSEIRLFGTPSQRIFEPADFLASGIERALIVVGSYILLPVLRVYCRPYFLRIRTGVNFSQGLYSLAGGGGISVYIPRSL